MTPQPPIPDPTHPNTDHFFIHPIIFNHISAISLITAHHECGTRIANSGSRKSETWNLEFGLFTMADCRFSQQLDHRFIKNRFKLRSSAKSGSELFTSHGDLIFKRSQKIIRFQTSLDLFKFIQLDLTDKQSCKTIYIGMFIFNRRSASAKKPKAYNQRQKKHDNDRKNYLGTCHDFDFRRILRIILKPVNGLGQFLAIYHAINGVANRSRLIRKNRFGGQWAVVGVSHFGVEPLLTCGLRKQVVSCQQVLMVPAKLKRNSVVAIFATTDSYGKTYQVKIRYAVIRRTILWRRFLEACQRSYCDCIFIQSSGVVPRASERLRAISAEIPELPFRMRERVARVTPRCSAAAVTEIPER